MQYQFDEITELLSTAEDSDDPKQVVWCLTDAIRSLMTVVAMQEQTIKLMARQLIDAQPDTIVITPNEAHS